MAMTPELKESWRQEPGTPAYCTDLNLSMLRRALAAANRARSMEMSQRLLGLYYTLPRTHRFTKL